MLIVPPLTLTEKGTFTQLDERNVKFPESVAGFIFEVKVALKTVQILNPIPVEVFTGYDDVMMIFSESGRNIHD